MLIGFIGCPGSGKTTTAALTFADLKEMGVAAEFIPEQARLHIAEKRLSLHQAPGSPVVLHDNDQVDILCRQSEAEATMVQSCGPETIVITDSSTFNSLLYMSDACREEIWSAWWEGRLKYDLLFYCAPVKGFSSRDPNRVHDQQQAREVDLKIGQLLKQYDVNPIYLLGDSKERHRLVTTAILERISR